MNRFKRHIALFFLLTIVWSSGGATVYSHFCKGADIAISSYVKIDHENIEQKCIHEQAVKESCHENEHDNSCCSDKVEFDTFDQVQAVWQDFLFLSTTLQQIIPVTIQQKIKKSEIVVHFNKPPPTFESRKSFLFHQFLC